VSGAAQAQVRPDPRPLRRRRAWLQTAVVALLVSIYLVGWTVYATTHTGERYRQLPPGAAGTRADAEVRLLSLTLTERLLDSGGGDPQVAEAGSTFVVAELELTQRRPAELVSCTADLLGPDQRLWERDVLGVQVQRPTPTCDSGDVVVGRPYRFEAVYVIPARFADRLAGVALTDHSTAGRTQVLQPPA
jgi:hypothetical protein